MKKIIFSLLALFSAQQSTLADQKIEVKTDKHNPTIRVETSGLSAKLSAGIKSDLLYSNWFNLSTPGKKADFVLKISGSDDKPRILLLDSDGNPYPKASFGLNLSGAQGNWKQHRLVDKVIDGYFSSSTIRDARDSRKKRDLSICSSQIVFSARNNNGLKELYLCDIDGRNVRKITNGAQGIAMEADWSPDNKTIAYTLIRSGSTAIVQLDYNSRRHRLLSHFDGLNSSPSFRPDGKALSVVLSKDRNVNIYWITPEPPRKGGNLTNSGAIEASPTWSPDSLKICYTAASVSARSKIGTPQLVIKNTKTNKAWRLFADGRERVSPDWSVSSGKLTYSKKQGNQYVICVCDPKDPMGTEEVITRQPGHWESPSWSPDGRHLVCVRKIGNIRELYIVDSLYKKTTRVNTGLKNVSNPDWSGIFKN